MDAGKLDRRITLRSVTVTQDAYGGVVETYADMATVWAQYLPGGGNERFVSAQVYAETQARFYLRWREGITTQHRVVFDGRDYDIVAADEIGRREGLELRVRARA